MPTNKPKVRSRSSALPLPTLRRYECGPFTFSNQDYYDRHLMFDYAVDIPEASPRQRYEAVARSVRDLLTQHWIRTQQTHDRVGRLYADPEAWSRQAILNIAGSGSFSSDRTIKQ